MPPSCPYHVDHGNRIERLEEEMKEVNKHMKSANITVAVISAIGVIVTALCSVAGVVLTSMAKANGWF